MKAVRNVSLVEAVSAVKLEHFYLNKEFGTGTFSYPKLYSNAVKTCEAGHFVEIGTYLGTSAVYMAVEIINSGKQIKFDCVDSWDEEFFRTDYKLEVTDDEIYKSFLKNIASVKHVINIVRAPSVDAATKYKDGSLDFVFIDAAHDFNSVLADLTAWYPKVKVGGVLAGHDYSTSDMKYCHVDRAVAAFFKTWDSFDAGENCFAITK